MKTIHKIAAMVIRENTFLMVRKVGADIWTSLGGKPEGNETEEQALLREIKEELACDAKIIKKLGDFEAKVAMDDAMLKLSTYLVQIKGPMRIMTLNLKSIDLLGKTINKKVSNYLNQLKNMFYLFASKLVC